MGAVTILPKRATVKGEFINSNGDRSISDFACYSYSFIFAYFDIFLSGTLLNRSFLMEKNAGKRQSSWRTFALFHFPVSCKDTKLHRTHLMMIIHHHHHCRHLSARELPSAILYLLKFNILFKLRGFIKV